MKEKLLFPDEVGVGRRLEIVACQAAVCVRDQVSNEERKEKLRERDRERNVERGKERNSERETG